MIPPSTASSRQWFEAAVAHAPAAPEQWLSENCNDPERRRQVTDLLKAHRARGGILDSPVVETFEAFDEEENFPVESLIGARIGDFRLIRLLGQGGMATVFLGEREGGDFRQAVAVKLLRRGLYSELEQRLFRRERQTLASLSHPGIARLIDGGLTEAGIPYLVMEYVDGLPVTRYVVEQQLGIRARLYLFVSICRAVDAAHRSLIVHRDIKPSNILVDRDGVAKLLDFGVAKLLDEDAESQTGTDLVPLTPGYAAPEQIAGGTITMATDVYALGVLLHELLLGERPFSDTTRRPSARVGDIAGERGRPRVTRQALRSALRGDLDNVLLKSLAAEPGRRYVSASALADDLERHLRAEPVSAHPPSRWYRTSKFVRRHRGGVMITVTLMLAVLVSLGTAVWQARAARVQAQRAENVRDFLLSIFDAAQVTLPKDRRPSLEELVERAGTRVLDSDHMDDAVRTDLLISLAKVARSVGADKQSLAFSERATPLVERLYPLDDIHTIEHRMLLAVMRKVDDAVGLLEPLRDTLLGRRDEPSLRALNTLVSALAVSGRFDDAQKLAPQALAIARELAGEYPDLYLETLIDQAGHLVLAQRFTEGLVAIDRAMEEWRKQHEQPSPMILKLYQSLNVAAQAVGNFEHAESALKAAVALSRRLYDKPHEETAWALSMYGSYLTVQGRYADAEPLLDQAWTMIHELRGNENTRSLNVLAAIARLRYGQGRYDEALTTVRRGLDACEHGAIRHNVCARLHAHLSMIQIERGRLDDAEISARRAIDWQTAWAGGGGPMMGQFLCDLVPVQVLLGDAAGALATAERAGELLRGGGGGRLFDELTLRANRAEALFDLDRNDEVLAEMADIEPAFGRSYPQRQALRFSMRALRARALARAGRNAEAAEAARDALAHSDAALAMGRRHVPYLPAIAAGSSPR